ncbi:MAG: molybdopterin-dependent oxidoreductase [Bacteroidota bacterium]
MEQIIVIINGKEITTSPDKTILEVIHENNIDEIPTLCHDNRLEHFTSCFLCVVEIEGMNKLVPSCSTFIQNGMKIWTRNKTVVESRKMALELLMSNHYADCIGPCKNSCPAGVDAQTYIALVSMGKYEEALKLVKENNPLPLSIGRVCVRDCETACRRNIIDEPVAVNALKRFIADEDSVHKWKPVLKERKNKKVAVIGGGPSGLACAYYLTIEGYSVTIFEKLPKLGGMLRYGIPEYRLPKKILDSEINWILDLGVEVKTNLELGIDFSIKDLLRSGYHSVFLGVGAHKASKLGLDGEDKIYGIFRGIDFLREIILSYIPQLHGRVIVVGGGNTAIDAARTALRCGAEEVKIVYRRSINEMPANKEEIAAAQKEGIEILFLTNPKSIIAEKNKLNGIECLKMELVEGLPGERPKPLPKPGSEFIIDCDFLIGAIGQSVDTGFVKFDNDCSLEKWGTVHVDNDTMETSIPGVFAGGDVVTGPLTAIMSIAQGRKAAKSIIGFLENGHVNKSANKFYSLKNKLTNITEREFEHENKLAREEMNELSVLDRTHNFQEVELGFSEIQCQLEAQRCLECGCSEYSDCQLRKYCDEYNIDISELTGETKKYLIDGRHPFILLDPNKCINCGRCVRTCSEVLKVSALGFVYRGFKSIIKPAMEKALAETNCIGCGNCIDACPTGAISEKYQFKVLGTLPKENRETICNFCSIGCKINFKKINDEIFYAANTTESIKNSHNKGFLCSKGRFGYRFLIEKNRILNPSIRKHGLIYNVKIDEALHYAASKLKSIMNEYGNDSVALLASPKLSNEELYLLQKFTRAGLNNNNISSFSNLLYGIEQNSLDDIVGFTSSTVSMDEIEHADIIVVINSNLSDENLVMELKIKAAQKKGAKLILINSSEISLTKYADLWVDTKKGTNTILINNLIKHCLTNNQIDREFLSRHQTDLRRYVDDLKEINKEDISRYCELDMAKYNAFIDKLQNINSNIIFISNLDSTSDKSINDIKAIGNFLHLTGRIGKPNNGIILLREFNNSVGLIEMGVHPDYLPGYVKLNERYDIKRIGEHWKTNLTEIFSKTDLARKLRRGEIKALLIFGEDPLMNKNSKKYFNGVEFMVVSDAFHTFTTYDADVILPASTYIEQTGTYTRCDNTLQLAPKIVNGINDFENWNIIVKLAKHFSDQFVYNSINEIMKEIKIVNRYYKHLDLSKSWLGDFFNNGYNEKVINFAETNIDLSTFDPVKPVIHYQENYYFSNVKSRLV